MRPIVPEDLRPASDGEAMRLFYQRTTALAVVHVKGGGSIEQVASNFWGREAGEVILRGAVSPTSTTGMGAALAPVGVAPFLRSLRGRSAAARLFDAAERLDLAGVSRVSLPAIPTMPAPAFVGEGAPLPAVRGTIGGAYLGPARKLGFVVGLTGELADATATAAETIIRLAMTDTAALALDAAVFSDVASSEDHPGGLLAGVEPIAPAAGGGLTALTADIKALVGAIAEAGGGVNVWLFANPTQAVVIKLLAGAAFDLPVIATPGLPEAAIVALEIGAVASGFSGLPEIDAAKETTVVWDDVPQPISTAGAPPVVATPVRSGFQSDTLSLRCILRAAWATRASGMVQWVENTSW